ncbi:MAG: hypothetical protein OXF32_03005 [Anaerolineaceae bacterium]|nr:hypothetical protein [Anaerolineaceae bacterium]
MKYNRPMLNFRCSVSLVWRALRTALLTLLTAACTMPAALDNFLADVQAVPEGESVAAPADPTPLPFVANLPVMGIAPELHDGAWLNTSTPLSLAGLRGKVVALEMWTFG